MTFKIPFLISSIAVLSLSACSGAKESLGLVQTSPDEFKVVKRAPLAMPPEYTLRPPRAGAPRPQEQSMSEEARQVVFGGSAEQEQPSTSSAEELLLQELGTEHADPNIRAAVESDLSTFKKEKQPIGTKLFGIGGNSVEDADVVNAIEESKRLHGGDKSVEQSVAAAAAAKAKAAEKAKAVAKAKAAKAKAAKVKAAKAAKKKAAKAAKEAKIKAEAKAKAQADAKAKAEAEARALKDAEAKAEAEATAKAEAEVKAAIEKNVKAIADETAKQSESVADDTIIIRQDNDTVTIIQNVKSKSSTATGEK